MQINGHKILIVDSCKSSLVMTSEIFKEKLIGSVIEIANSGLACLNLLEEKTYDMLVIDFDLPDADGVSLAKHIREKVSTPLVITAFPEKIVSEAIDIELFGYHDCSMWVEKPVKADKLIKSIDLFLIDKKRYSKRFIVNMSTLVSGKSEGRGKKPPKVKANLINLSLGGAMIKSPEAIQMKAGDEINLTFDLPYTAGEDANKKSSTKSTKTEDALPLKLKGKVVWMNKKKNQLGVQFDALPELTKKSLEHHLRQSEEISL